MGTRETDLTKPSQNGKSKLLSPMGIGGIDWTSESPALEAAGLDPKSKSSSQMVASVRVSLLDSWNKPGCTMSERFKIGLSAWRLVCWVGIPQWPGLTVPIFASSKVPRARSIDCAKGMYGIGGFARSALLCTFSVAVIGVDFGPDELAGV